jgi:aminoglycoside N3'-acetyltransferase
LAVGKDSAWIVADHDKCLYPCGVGTPFDKFRQLHGKLLFFDVSFGAITFFHFVEDVVKHKLPFPAYDERLFSVPVIDEQGQARVVQTYAFTTGVIRDTRMLEQELLRRKQIVTGRVGHSKLMLVNAEEVVSAFTDMVDSGDPPYATGAR